VWHGGVLTCDQVVVGLTPGFALSCNNSRHLVLCTHAPKQYNFVLAKWLRIIAAYHSSLDKFQTPTLVYWVQIAFMFTFRAVILCCRMLLMWCILCNSHSMLYGCLHEHVYVFVMFSTACCNLSAMTKQWRYCVGLWTRGILPACSKPWGC